MTERGLATHDKGFLISPERDMDRSPRHETTRRGRCGVSGGSWWRRLIFSKPRAALSGAGRDASTAGSEWVVENRR